METRRALIMGITEQDESLAQKALGWRPKTKFEDLVKIISDSELDKKYLKEKMFCIISCMEEYLSFQNIK